MIMMTGVSSVARRDRTVFVSLRFAVSRLDWLHASSGLMGSSMMMAPEKPLLHEPAKARHLPAGGRGVDAGSPPPLSMFHRFLDLVSRRKASAKAAGRLPSPESHGLTCC